MGLFGYSEKDYRKNTEEFKKKIQNVYTNLNMRGIKNYEVGNALTSIMTVLDMFEYPKGAESKKQKAVDDYIVVLIGKIEEAARQRNTAKLVLHAKSLNEMISDGRSTGELPRSAEDLKANEILNDCLGELNQVGERKENIKRRKMEILQECKRLESVGAGNQMAPLKNEYMMLESEEKTIARKENELSKTYQYNCDALANAKDREFYKTLGAGDFVALSPQNVGKLVKDISTSIERNNTAVTSGMDILSEFENDYQKSAGSVSSKSSFEADFESSKAADAMQSVDGSTYTPAQTESSDPFEAALRNFQG